MNKVIIAFIYKQLHFIAIKSTENFFFGFFYGKIGKVCCTLYIYIYIFSLLLIIYYEDYEIDYFIFESYYLYLSNFFRYL